VGVRTWIGGWPVYRQLADGDLLGRGAAAKSPASARRVPRTATADKVIKSVCPYCAVGSANLQLTTGPARQRQVLYRRPFGTDREHLDLDTAMDMIADRVIAARNQGWQWEQDGVRTRRTLGFASLGGATLDNEENYLIKKLFTALGAIQIENQARI
jgi:formate dehydrogenase major subunit